MANEVDELEKFLNLISSQTGENGVVNGLNTVSVEKILTAFL